MTKKFYIFAWMLLIGTALMSILNGAFNAVAMLSVSIGAVVLVYLFALWAVTRDSQEAS